MSVHSRKSQRGQSLVEFALVVPLIVLLIVNAVNFGTYLYAIITIANAARAGAEYSLIGGAMIHVAIHSHYRTGIHTSDARYCLAPKPGQSSDTRMHE